MTDDEQHEGLLRQAQTQNSIMQRLIESATALTARTRALLQSLGGPQGTPTQAPPDVGPKQRR